MEKDCRKTNQSICIMKPKAYSYLRFSTIAQLQGNSQERQLDASRLWCVENNLHLVEEMQDHGVSAFRGKNRMLGVLGKFLELVRLGKIEKDSLLIVENIDRLSREKVLDALTLYIELIKADISIVTLIDRQTHSRESIEKAPYLLQMAIASMVRANDESEIKSSRGGSNWAMARKKAMNGEKPTIFKFPSWIKRDQEGEPVLIKSKAFTIKRIYELASSGYTPFSIAETLNKEGHSPLTKLGKSGLWQVSTIRKLLKAKSVCGTLVLNEPYIDNGERKYRVAGEIENYLPKAVSVELFAKVQSILLSRSQTSTHRTGGSKASPKNAFSGIIKSVNQGGISYQKNGGRFNYEYLKAEKFVTDPSSERKSKMWNYLDFQDIFVATCRLALKATSQTTKEEQNLGVLEIKLSETKKSMTSLLELAKFATESKADLLIELEKMAIKKNELTSEVAEIKAKILTANQVTEQMPKDVSDRVELNRVLKANVKVLLLDIPNKMFTCELFSGVSYQAWMDKANRLFVQTNDFEVPVDAFDDISIRSTHKHFIKEQDFTARCEEFAGDKKKLSEEFGISEGAVGYRIHKYPKLRAKFTKMGSKPRRKKILQKSTR